MNKGSLYLLFGIALGCLSLVTLMTGETHWNLVWEGAKQRIAKTTTQWNPLLDERIPRLIVILCTGASLAVSGAVMQSLFHNPLASPSVLGISAGGSLMALLTLIFGWHFNYPYAIPLTAFGGCLLTLAAVFFFSRRKGETHLSHLILTGIAISIFILAIESTILYALRDRWQLIQIVTEWHAGSTTDRNWQHVHMQFPLTLIGLFGCLRYRSEINLLALGDEEAKNLGVEVEAIRWRLFLCVSLLTGGAIAAVGTITFFGLILPHVIRRLAGPNNKQLIPLSIATGSTALLSLDLLLRLSAVHSFSIGNVSAILGGLFFLTLLFGSHKQAETAF